MNVTSSTCQVKAACGGQEWYQHSNLLLVLHSASHAVSSAHSPGRLDVKRARVRTLDSEPGGGADADVLAAMVRKCAALEADLGIAKRKLEQPTNRMAAAAAPAAAEKPADRQLRDAALAGHFDELAKLLAAGCAPPYLCAPAHRRCMNSCSHRYSEYTRSSQGDTVIQDRGWLSLPVIHSGFTQRSCGHCFHFRSK